MQFHRKLGGRVSDIIISTSRLLLLDTIMSTCERISHHYRPGGLNRGQRWGVAKLRQRWQDAVEQGGITWAQHLRLFVNGRLTPRSTERDVSLDDTVSLQVLH